MLFLAACVYVFTITVASKNDHHSDDIALYFISDSHSNTIKQTLSQKYPSMPCYFSGAAIQYLSKL